MIKMDLKDIRDIIESVGKMKISYFELEKGDLKIVIKNSDNGNLLNRIEVEAEGCKENIIADSKQEKKENKGQDDILIVRSPLVGTYYSAASPDSKPFGEAGARVKTGETLCIIEAMKVMNDITAEYEGEIVEVFVENGDLVEYGQPIMSIRK
jgi:acetyl-CoA carboxylase biotin carboxyl carrier protein